MRPSLTSSAARMTKLLLWTVALGSAEAARIFQSTVILDLGLESNTEMYGARELFDVERKAASYITNVLQVEDTISLKVAVMQQALVPGGGVGLETLVSIEYLADGPFSLKDTLKANADPVELAAALKVSTIQIVYGQAETSTILSIQEGSEGTDTGLLVSTICLAVVLLVLASVMLYTTGACTACCYKEVEEKQNNNNNREIQKVDTFPAQSYDEESCSIAESSVAGTAASGILGAIGNDEASNPALGLGIKTSLNDESTNIEGSEFGDGESAIGLETPLSHMTERSANMAALGITSMRKLEPETPDSPNEVDKSAASGMQGALSHMILGRLKYESK